jgi:PIN domain nuclease of toxin-antitoxin system
MAQRMSIKYLVDTCALFALAEGSLSMRAAHAVESTPDVFVSLASLWEVAIKQATGKLSINHKPLDWYERLLQNHSLTELSMTRQNTVKAAALPPIHKDPFDRLIIATAMIHKLTIITSDEKIIQYPGIKTLW